MEILYMPCAAFGENPEWIVRLHNTYRSLVGVGEGYSAGNMRKLVSAKLYNGKKPLRFYHSWIFRDQSYENSYINKPVICRIGSRWVPIWIACHSHHFHIHKMDEIKTLLINTLCLRLCPIIQLWFCRYYDSIHLKDKLLLITQFEEEKFHYQWNIQCQWHGTEGPLFIAIQRQ